MHPHDQTGVQLSDQAICNLIKETGYDGIAVDLGFSSLEEAKKLLPIIKKK